MEDIEGVIERIEKKLERKADYDTGVWLAQIDVENLIKAFKELENKDNFYKDLEQKYFEVSKQLTDLNAEYFKLKQDSISKSKVKEKIEELEKEYKQIEETSDFIIADTIQPKIEVLQELMEDK